MPKIDCIKITLDDICISYCPYKEECPADAECAYRIRIREIIEDIRDDNTGNGVDEA